MHAWQHLGHFFSSQLSSKEFWAAIIGAVVGGLMTVIAAILAQKQAAKDQRQRDLQTEQRILNNILRSIAAELKVLKTGTERPGDRQPGQHLFTVLQPEARIS
jgi:hypothetical protein